MESLSTTIFQYLHAIWRRKWMTAFAAWAICIVGWTVIAMMPSKYESSARVYVDGDGLLGPLLRGIAVEVDPAQQLDVLQRTLLSRPNLEQLIHMADLDSRARTNADKEGLIRALPEGPRYFPKDQITDQPERFLVAELIREQVLLATEQEVPYATTVLIDQYEEGARLTRIAATIFCERDGQKAILIGKQAANLKKIGTKARLQIQSLLNTKVYLELFVKVRPGWRDSRDFVQETDWRTQLERMSSGEHHEEPEQEE